MALDLKVLRVLLYNQPIGTLTRFSGDKILFAWDQEYIDHPSRPTLSLSFKDTLGHLITDIRMTQTRLSPFFSNLLPEGSLREYLAAQANIHPQHEFLLLATLGQDLPGALTIQPMDWDPSLPQVDLSTSKRVRKRDLSFHFSLAGVQLKFSAVQKSNHKLLIPPDGVGGNWIIKLPHSTFSGVPENEYSMMELARRVGIDVPEIALHSMRDLQGLPEEFQKSGHQIFAIKRFDRAENGEGIHIEDFAQVFGVYPEKKYKNASYRNIAEVIWKETGEVGLIEFIKRFVFNALIGNGDMHLKNWSLIYREKNKPSLAPAYDFVSTIFYLPGDQLALNFVDSKDFKSLSFDQFKRFSTKANLPEKLVLNTVRETAALFSEKWKTVHDLPLSEQVRSAITAHLKTIPLYKSPSV